MPKTEKNLRCKHWMKKLTTAVEADAAVVEPAAVQTAVANNNDSVD